MYSSLFYRLVFFLCFLIQLQFGFLLDEMMIMQMNNLEEAKQKVCVSCTSPQDGDCFL